MVAVSDRVWYWREAREREDTETIELLFAPRLPADEAYEALRNAVRTVMERHLSQPEPLPGVDEPSVGACSLTLVRGGGVLRENELPHGAFGVQLLGSGYDASPEAPEWKRSPLEDGVVLVEHADPHAWYARLFGPFGGYRTTPTDPELIPELVARAREGFRALLFTDDVAREHLRCDHVC